MKNLTKWAVVERGPLTASGQDEILLTAKTPREARTMANAAGYINNRAGGVTYDLVRLPEPASTLPPYFEGIEFRIEARTAIGPQSEHTRHGQVFLASAHELHTDTPANLPALLEKHIREIAREAAFGPTKADQS